MNTIESEVLCKVEKDILAFSGTNDSIILLVAVGIKLASRSLINDSSGYCLINDRVDCWSLDFGSINLEQ